MMMPAIAKINIQLAAALVVVLSAQLVAASDIPFDYHELDRQRV